MRTFIEVCKFCRMRHSLWKVWPKRSRSHEVRYWLPFRVDGVGQLRLI